MNFTDQQNQELNTAYQRQQAGTPGAATATNAGDIANLDYAMKNGWKPTVPAVTPAENLGNTPTVTQPEPNPSTVDLAMTSFKTAQDGLSPAQQQYNDLSAGNSNNAAITGLETENAKLKQGVLDSIQGLGGRGAALTAAEASLGLPEQRKRLAELTTQIAQRNAEFDKATESLSGSTGLTTTIQGKQGQLRRQQAVEVGALTSVAQAVQGNIALAQQTAERTVNLEFEDRQNHLTLLKEQLSQNYENLSRAEKKKADELSTVLALQQKQLDQEKEDKKNIMSVMLEAAKNGADSHTLNNIKGAKTVEDAISAAGMSLGEGKQNVLNIMLEAAKNGADAETQKKIASARTPQEAIMFAGQYLQAAKNSDFGVIGQTVDPNTGATVNTYGFINKVTGEVSPVGGGGFQDASGQFQNGNPSAPSSGTLGMAETIIREQGRQYDASLMLGYAQQYASTGSVPEGIPKGSFGVVSEIAKQLPKPSGTLVDVNTGIKSAKLSSGEQDGITALYDIAKKTQELKELDQKRWHGFVPGAIGWAFGTEDQSKYIALRDEIVDLLARARSGAALTENEEKSYKEKLPGRLSETLGLGTDSQLKIDSFAKSIDGTLRTRLETTGTSLYGFSKVKVGDSEYHVGDVISNGDQNARVNPDGSLTVLGQGFNQPLSMGENGSTSTIGSLSAKYESGGNPGAIGYDNTGGWSYGTYQLAHDNALSFVKQSPYSKDFQGLTFNSDAWRQRWQQVAQQDPQGFEQAQREYIQKTHFEPQVNKLAQIGVNIDNLSPVLKDVIWSTAVQHGGNTDIIAKAFRALGNKANEADLIKKIYELRWSNGRSFANSTQDVRQSVYNRFFGNNGELKNALARVNSLG